MFAFLSSLLVPFYCILETMLSYLTNSILKIEVAAYMISKDAVSLVWTTQMFIKKKKTSY